MKTEPLVAPAAAGAKAPSTDLEARVEATLAGMDVDRKIGQMTQAERASVTPDDVRTHRLGSVLSGAGSSPDGNRPSDWVEMSDALWAGAMAPDGPRIPILYGTDAVHGHSNVAGATIFPHNIGLGAANDPDLVERIARVTAREVLATGVEWTFAPTLAVARDVRWGRTYESFSDDPEIVSRYAGRIVHGLQADEDDDGVIACAKHWVGDGGTAAGRDQGDTRIDEAEMRRVHMAPYHAALAAGVRSVMASYNSWNGVRCHGSRYLLDAVLKHELGFDGLVVSDWDAVEQLDPDYGRAVAMAVNAGVDLFMVPQRWRDFMSTLKRQIEAGRVSRARIDDAVRRILRVKFASGIVDAPRPAERPWSDHSSFGSAAHRAVAREAVRKSLVLLKNEDRLLPLSRGARILVAGRNANDVGHQCGGFTVAWQGTTGNDEVKGGTSIWEGIRDVAPDAVLHRGGELPGDAFDVAVVVIGERPYAEGLGDIRSTAPVPDPAAAGTPLPGPQAHRPYGDTLALSTLHPEDLRIISEIADRGIPVVALLLSGRPLMVDPELERSDAFVAAWLPGSEGAGVSDVLFGDHEFQGVLSFPWRAGPRSSHPGPETAPIRFPRGHGLRMG